MEKLNIVFCEVNHFRDLSFGRNLEYAVSPAER